MRFLGTAAADLLPAPLCKCPICSEARKDPKKGRLRSSFLLDSENLIDCGPDLAAAVMRHGVDITGLRSIFVTHTHEDHFCISNAGFINMSSTRNGEPVDIYLSEAGFAHVERTIKLLKSEMSHSDAMRALDRGYIRLHEVRTGKPFSVDGYDILAVNTTHRVSESETAINYRFRKGGMSLLYACDTGYYIQESLDLLKNSDLDILIMEGTWGSRIDMPEDSHLNAYAFLKQMDIFREYGIIQKGTKIFCTHINHKHSWNHNAYQKFFDEATDYDVTVAYDGLEL